MISAFSVFYGRALLQSADCSVLSPLVSERAGLSCVKNWSKSISRYTTRSSRRAKADAHPRQNTLREPTSIAPRRYPLSDTRRFVEIGPDICVQLICGLFATRRPASNRRRDIRIFDIAISVAIRASLMQTIGLPG